MDGVTVNGTDNVQCHRDVVSVLYVTKGSSVGVKLHVLIELSGEQVAEVAWGTLHVKPLKAGPPATPGPVRFAAVSHTFRRTQCS